MSASPAAPASPVSPALDAASEADAPTPDASEPTTPQGLYANDVSTLADRFRALRAHSERFCEPLNTEDYVVQTVENVSPTKWHLAHTTWFFETFILKQHVGDYELYHEAYPYLFNSYYIQAGERHCRDRRGYISRPTVAEVKQYRRHVTDALSEWMETASDAQLRDIAPLVELGIHHEQQHQELMVTDIKHVLSVNPLRPAYRADLPVSDVMTPPTLDWVAFDEGVYEVGRNARCPEDGFCYDNETPQHKQYLRGFQLANRLVTNAEYVDFIEDGGYERPELWLSAGWATVQENDWTEPFYWENVDGRWHTYTLGGFREVHPAEPVCHLTYFEAEAFARWNGARLPREGEWEVAARGLSVQGNFVDADAYHPQPATQGDGVVPDGGDGPLYQMFGDVWEWTQSHYSPYPGYEPLPGAIGEYNGKFMCGQFVLKGGSCATSQSHVRPTYRNFFHPDEAWQFMGLRLAKDA